MEKTLMQLFKESEKECREITKNAFSLALANIFFSTDVPLYRYKSVGAFLTYKEKRFWDEQSLEVKYKEVFSRRMFELVSKTSFNYALEKIDRKELYEYFKEEKERENFFSFKEIKVGNLYINYCKLLTREIGELSRELYKEIKEESLYPFLKVGFSHPDYKEKWEKERLVRMLN